ncbi:hypothetical protein HPB48_001021 [Haemaphysalis longicornis]|uniref:Uncharacterized protein n=1 Tax=Haemaphysalis longicornis TaxID=44386 RepID=A0A9J6G2C0_HAELO|nr:hypothetical protein HPB48_001021 [Haemaphysalis longicornis]
MDKKEPGATQAPEVLPLNLPLPSTDDGYPSDGPMDAEDAVTREKGGAPVGSTEQPCSTSMQGASVVIPGAFATVSEKGDAWTDIERACSGRKEDAPWSEGARNAQVSATLGNPRRPNWFSKGGCLFVVRRLIAFGI